MVLRRPGSSGSQLARAVLSLARAEGLSEVRLGGQPPVLLGKPTCQPLTSPLPILATSTPQPTPAIYTLLSSLIPLLQRGPRLAALKQEIQEWQRLALLLTRQRLGSR